MSSREADHSLEFLLAFDGRVHHLEKGLLAQVQHQAYSNKQSRPHGFLYSFTLHAPGGARLVGFDNAHSVEARGAKLKQRSESHDHWHRTENDRGRPYEFKDAETLLEDFFNEVERVLRERGVSSQVTKEAQGRRPK